MGTDLQTSQKIIIRKNLEPYWDVIDHSTGAVKCKIENCKNSKTGEPTVFKYKKEHGWWNFERHLASAHKIVLDVPSDKDKGSILRHFPPSFKKNLSVKGSYKRNDPKQISFERDMLDFIAIDGVPLDISRQPGFVQLLKNRDPNLRMPSRRSIGRKLSESCGKVRRTYIAKMKKVPNGCLHLSLDLWTSKSHQAILGIRAHFVDDEFVLQNLTIGFKHFPHMKSGHNLRQFVKCFLIQAGVKPQQIGVVMADNAAENVKAFDLGDFIEDTNPGYDGETSEEDTSDDEAMDQRDQMDSDDSNEASAATSPNLDDDIGEAELDELFESVNEWAVTTLQRLGCTCHGLNLVMKECTTKHERAQELLNMVSKLVTFFHHSSFWANELKKKIGTNLVKAGTTRWNSNVLALNRLLEPNVMDSINAVLIKAKEKKAALKQSGAKPPDPIPPSVEAEMKEMAALLSPFLLATNRLQAGGVTSSLVLGTIICMYKAIARVTVKNKSMETLQTTICLSLSERFGADKQMEYCGRGARKQLLRVFEKAEYILATVLDPRIKLGPFKIPLVEPYNLDKYACSITKAMSILEDALSSLAEKSSEDAEVIADTLEMEKSHPQMDKDEIFGDMFSEETSPPAEASNFFSIKHEMQTYLEEPKQPEASDPLQYWRKNSERLPLLSKLARRYLGFPASSADVERTFSISGSLARSRRASLWPVTIENILMHREKRISK